MNVSFVGVTALATITFAFSFVGVIALTPLTTMSGLDSSWNSFCFNVFPKFIFQTGKL